MNRRELTAKAPLLAGVVAGVVEVPKKARGFIVTIKDDFNYEDIDDVDDIRGFDNDIENMLQKAFGADMKVVVVQGADVKIVN